jgi:GNAT superfamily N-acetyltransferase
MTPEGLLRLDMRHARRVAELLADAFFRNPMFVHLLPDEAVRRKAMAAIYGTVARVCLAEGLVFATSEDMEGVICLSLRGAGRHGSLKLAWEQLKSFTLPFRLMRHVSTLAVARRASVMRKATSEMRKRIKSLGECVYVDMTAVREECRGRGVMSRMMRAVLKESDKLALRCVLETEEKTNADIYAHFEFSTDRIIEVVPNTFRYYIMVYEPKLAKDSK